MKRFKVLLGQRRFQVLATMAVLLLAASIVYASGANFTAQTANPSNVFTAGALTMSNSKTGAALFATSNKLKPGDMVPGSVVITNTGDLSGAFTLNNANVTQLVAPALSTLLTVKIYDTKLLPLPVGTKTQIYGGANGIIIGTDPNLSLGTFAPGESHQYDFEFTFPAGTPTHDNPYQKASMSVEYDWNATAGS